MKKNTLHISLLTIFLILGLSPSVPASFPNHGQFVSCVAHAANDAVAQGLISPQEKARFVRNAARGG